MHASLGIKFWILLAQLIGSLMVGDAPDADGGKATSNKLAEPLNVIEAQMKWREKVEAENRRNREGMEALQTENVVLAQTMKRLARQHEAATNALKYLRINDYLMENRPSLISSLQREWLPRKDPMFAALWQQGRVLRFEVSDIFLYQTNVVARVDFLWANPDASGDSGRQTFGWTR